MPPGHAGSAEPVRDIRCLSAGITELMAWINGTSTTDGAIEQILTLTPAPPTA
jgi:hypothetical protein